MFDYIHFTNVTDQLLLERFFDRDGAPNCTVTLGGTADRFANRPNGPVGAFRDVGVQVFDAFEFGEWEHSYAVMLGNGNGITRGDNDDNKDLYLYWSSEWVFGGEGPRHEGLKLFAWSQDGKRTLVTGGTGTQSDTDGSSSTAGTKGEFDRSRDGAGLTFRKDRYRAAAEYVKAMGMIFDGTDGGAVAGSLHNAGTVYASFNIAPVDKADGYYLDFGYKVLPALELDVRYDRLNRRTETPSAERRFTTLTLGVQYFFDKRNRIAVNYEFRDAEAPNLPSSDTANKVLGAMDDRISVQLTSIFRAVSCTRLHTFAGGVCACAADPSCWQRLHGREAVDFFCVRDNRGPLSRHELSRRTISGEAWDLIARAAQLAEQSAVCRYRNVDLFSARAPLVFSRQESNL